MAKKMGPSLNVAVDKDKAAAYTQDSHTVAREILRHANILLAFHSR